MSSKDVHVSEHESRKVAEASREEEWKQPSFLRELFLGNFRLDLIHPYPLPRDERPEFTAFYNAFRELMRDQVDAVDIDATGEYPEHVVDALRTMRAQRLAALEVRSEVQRRFNNWVSKRHEDTVWSQGGCMSWYTTSTGKNTTLWPGFTWQFRLRTRRFDRHAYLAVAESEPCRKSATPVGGLPVRRATV